MKKRIIIVAILLGAVALGGTFYMSGRRADSSGGLTLYGNVDIREATLAFRVGGRVEAVLKEEGEVVTEGELLARLDNEPFREQLRQAEAELQSRKSHLAMLRNGYRREEIEQEEAKEAQARAYVENARKELDRQLQLQANRAGTDQHLDDAQARMDESAAGLEVAGAHLRLLKAGFRPEEIEQAEAAVNLAQAKVDEAATRLDDTLLHAPSPGVLRTRIVEKGTMVTVGSPVFVISLQENPWVRAYVPESRFGEIVPGMPVEVMTDSRPDRPYQGHIGFISPTAEFTPKSIYTEDLRTSLVYRFRVILENPDQKLRQGMPVTVRLISVNDKD